MNRPRLARSTAVIAVLDVVLFALANIPALANAKNGAGHIVGGVLWMGFLAGVLTLLVLLAIVITRATRQRRAAS